MSTTAISSSGGFFEVHRRVARTYAQGRLARTVSGFHRARSAGGIDQPDVFVMHQVDIIRNGGRFHAGENSFRRSVLRTAVSYMIRMAPGSSAKLSDGERRPRRFAS